MRLARWRRAHRRALQLRALHDVHQAEACASRRERLSDASLVVVQPEPLRVRVQPVAPLKAHVKILELEVRIFERADPELLVVHQHELIDQVVDGHVAPLLRVLEEARVVLDRRALLEQVRTEEVDLRAELRTPALEPAICLRESGEACGEARAFSPDLIEWAGLEVARDVEECLQVRAVAKEKEIAGMKTVEP